MRHVVFAVAVVSSLVTRSPAQDAAPADLSVATLSLSVEPGVWYLAPGGQFRFPSASSSDHIHAEDINMDNPRLSPFVELNVNAGSRWGGTLRAVTMAANSREFTTAAPLQFGDTALPSGTTARASFDFLQVEAEVRYALYPYWRTQPETASTKHWQNLDHRFDLVGGVRLLDFNLDVSRDVSGTSTPVADASATFVMPYAGIKGSVIIAEKLTIDLTTSFGGMAGLSQKQSFAWDILVGFQYHLTPNLGAQIGYRQFLLRLNETDSHLKWDGATAGLYFGFVGTF